MASPDSALARRARFSGLLTLTARVAQQRMTTRLEQCGVSYAQASALALLWQSEKGELRQRDFVSALVLSRASGTLLLADLETAGLVVRAPDPADARRQLVKLTTRGRALERPVSAILGELHAELEALVSEEELSATVRSLERLLGHLQVPRQL